VATGVVDTTVADMAAMADITDTAVMAATAATTTRVQDSRRPARGGCQTEKKNPVWTKGPNRILNYRP